jgi:hypothetical protein
MFVILKCSSNSYITCENGTQQLDICNESKRRKTYLIWEYKGRGGSNIWEWLSLKKI